MSKSVNQKIAAVIPARLMSTRLSRKVLLPIGDKAMIHHVVDRAEASGLFDEIIVAADHEEIKRYCNKHDIKCILTDESHQSGTDRVAEVATKLEADVIVNIQGDEPFVSPAHLELLVNSFGDLGVNICTLKHPLTVPDDVFDYNNVKVITNDKGNAIYFSRQAIPGQRDIPYREWHHHFQYMKHVGVYAYRKSILLDLVKLPASELETVETLEQLRWLTAGHEIRVIEVDGGSIGVDTKEDLKLARAHYAKIEKARISE